MQENPQTPLELLSSYVARYSERKAMIERGDARKHDSYLAFRAGEGNYLLSMESVFEVLTKPPEITKLPFTAHWLCGLATYRGEVYSIVDFKDFVADKRRFPAQEQANYLLLRDVAQGYILKVDSVLGIRTAEVTSLRAQWPWIDAHAQIDGCDWLRINLANLVTDRVFTQRMQ